MAEVAARFQFKCFTPSRFLKCNALLSFIILACKGIAHEIETD